MADLGVIGLSFTDASGPVGLVPNGITWTTSSSTSASGHKSTGSVVLTQPTVNVLYSGLPGFAQAAGILTGSGTPRITPFVVSGKVTARRVAVPYALVRVYSRASGNLLGQTTTDGSGNYSISIYSSNEQVTVITLDPDGGVNYNAVIMDQVVPVDPP